MYAASKCLYLCLFQSEIPDLILLSAPLSLSISLSLSLSQFKIHICCFSTSN